jgi:hypothetical protein
MSSSKKFIALATDGAVHLARILGMLGSDHAGERAAAGLKADRIVRDLGLTWHEVIVRTPPDIDRRISFCLANAEACTEWEQGFLRNIAGREGISEKQEAVLDRIYRKAEIHAGLKT